MADVTQPRQDDDLGIGARVALLNRSRFLNRDGSFNVRRRGLSFLRSQNTYHSLLSMSWTKYFLIIAGAYFAVNLLFGAAYALCGPGALGADEDPDFLTGFFFSVQTLATIGYGKMAPHGLLPNILVTVEALVGLLGFALATGLLFARFSRPSAHIIYSRHAVVAPYRDRTAFEFRIANGRSNELVDVHVSVTFSRLRIDPDGSPRRVFTPLALERTSVVFMPLHWVVVHPIDETSPLAGATEETLAADDAEFLILLTAVDETFSQTVFSRSSYKAAEIVWGARFADMFMDGGEGRLGVDLRRIHDLG